MTNPESQNGQNSGNTNNERSLGESSQDYNTSPSDWYTGSSTYGREYDQDF